MDFRHRTNKLDYGLDRSFRLHVRSSYGEAGHIRGVGRNRTSVTSKYWQIQMYVWSKTRCSAANRVQVICI